MACPFSVQVIEETCSRVVNALGYPSLKDEQKTVLMNFILGNDVCDASHRIWKESLLRLFAMCF